MSNGMMRVYGLVIGYRLQSFSIQCFVFNFQGLNFDYLQLTAALYLIPSFPIPVTAGI